MSSTRNWAIGATIVALVVAGGTVALVSRGDSPEGATSFTLEVSSAPGAFAASIDVGGAPAAMGTGFGSVWVAVPEQQSILRLNSKTSLLDALIPFEVPAPCGEIVTDDRWVWVGDCRSDSITVIDPDTNTIVGTVQGQGIAGPASSGQGMWVWSNIEGKITLYDDVSEDWEEKFQLWNNLTVPDASVGFGSVWVLDKTERQRLSPVDERTGAFPDINVPAVPTDVSAGAGSVWIGSDPQGLVLRFDPDRRRFTAQIEVGEPGGGIDLATTTETVWARAGDSLARIDPRSGEAVEEFRAPSGPSGIAVAPGGVWIGNRDGSVWRLDLP